MTGRASRSRTGCECSSDSPGSTTDVTAVMAGVVWVWPSSASSRTPMTGAFGSRTQRLARGSSSSCRGPAPLPGQPGSRRDACQAQEASGRQGRQDGCHELLSHLGVAVPNRLANSASPYLLQHQDNPVDWYEWGDEAFAAARLRDVPILLSVGYAACHWCHVMAHESFEDEATAKAVNDSFV